MARQTSDKLYFLRKRLEPGYAHPDEDFQDHLKEKSGRVWVDLGCGVNPFVAEYAARFRFAVGCDRDLRLCARASGPFFIGDFSRLPLADGSTDLVTSYMVAEHMERPVHALREIRRVLKPGGRIVLCASLKYFWGSLLNRALPEAIKIWILRFLTGKQEEDVFKAYYRMNTLHEAEEALKEAGFSDIKIKGYCGYYQFSTLFFHIQRFFHCYTPLGRTALMRSHFLAQGVKLT